MVEAEGAREREKRGEEGDEEACPNGWRLGVDGEREQRGERSRA